MLQRMENSVHWDMGSVMWIPGIFFLLRAESFTARRFSALKRESSYEDLSIQVEGRADGIFTEEETTWIDEIKGIYGNVEKLEQPVAVHKAQAMCYGYIVAMEENLSSIGIQMTYANLDTEEIKRFREVFSIEDLSDWYQKLLDEYHKWLSYSLKWKKERN